MVADSQVPQHEKTEEATPKRVDDARLEGQVARSMELNSMAVLLASTGVLYFAGKWMIDTLNNYMGAVFIEAPVKLMNVANIQEILSHATLILFKTLAPLLLTVLVAGILVNVLQVGFTVSTKTLEPKLDKINPIKGFKNIFSAKSLGELVKSILKISLVGLVIWLLLRKELPALHLICGASPALIASHISGIALKLLLWVLGFMAALSILDFAFQRWNHAKQLRMTVQEVKEERKQTEGDPQLKSKIRGLQQETAYNQMISTLPQADVVVTNPTHIAVALKYNDNMAAPIVVAQGQRLLAQRIKDIARDHGIPIIENKPLARALFKACDVGMEIPVDLYRATAELLAYVVQLKNRKKRA
jgi:flagellar biosynthesis protein FlhB